MYILFFAIFVIFEKIASNGILQWKKMMGSHDPNQRGFIVKIMFCIHLCSIVNMKLQTWKLCLFADISHVILNLSNCMILFVCFFLLQNAFFIHAISFVKHEESFLFGKFKYSFDISHYLKYIVCFNLVLNVRYTFLYHLDLFFQFSWTTSIIFKYWCIFKTFKEKTIHYLSQRF